MKFYFYFILIVTGIHSTFSYAEEFVTRFPGEEMNASGLGNFSPVHYVFNEAGELIFKEKGLAKNIVKYLEKRPPIEDSKEEKEMLTPFMPEGYQYTSAEYTIVLVRFGNYDACAPCRQHEQRIKKIHDTLIDKQINFVQVVFESKKGSTIMVSDSEFNGLMEDGNE